MTEQIPRLAGHKGTGITEIIYRKQIRPVVDDEATVMDVIFGIRSHSDTHSADHETEDPEPDEGSDLQVSGGRYWD